ncbi:MAG: 1-acyl-sn-glycerol-3-phosphate acyltransferase, partial [Planctomycetales bacterium]
VGVAMYGFRCVRREVVPKTGGGVIVANHQSHFDPVLIGLACDRPLTYLARESLFRFPPFRWLIRFYQAVPVRRDGLGLDGLREIIRRLKRGEIVVVFPEGTRTPDGEVQEFQPGLMALVRKTKVPVIPVGFDGPYQIWSRNSRFPRPLGVVQMAFGEPLEPEEIAKFEERELMAELHDRVKKLHAEARDERNRRISR